ncbi:MAG TPA: hypothetical protein PK313_02065 [Myxococcota bacterium]|jgi:3-hydroxymyristoyl/3-hydroxydecanoyl-(acyl carrier protein) dehydratase|nr:hypothetical protein [Myxococcota bacterium]
MHDLDVQELVVLPDAITGRVAIPDDHPAFDGHFPGRPILPGVAQLDLVLGLLDRALNAPVTLRRVRRMKFSSTVTPGATLAFRLEPDAARTRVAWTLSTPRAEASSGVLDIAVGAA